MSENQSVTSTSDALLSQPPPSSAATPTAQYDPPSAGIFSPEQLNVLANDLVKSGRITEAEAKAALSADNVEFKKAEKPDATDLLMPAAKPKDFIIPINEVDGRNKEVLNRANLARNWLSEGRFTKEVGNYIVSEVVKISEIHAGMSESQRELYKRTEAQKLQKLWGNRSNEMISAAADLVRQLDKKNPGLIDLLESSGAGNSAMVVAKIAGQAMLLKGKRNAR